jgi:hypothetical protein
VAQLATVSSSTPPSIGVAEASSKYFPLPCIWRALCTTPRHCSRYLLQERHSFVCVYIYIPLGYWVAKAGSPSGYPVDAAQYPLGFVLYICCVGLLTGSTPKGCCPWGSSRGEDPTHARSVFVVQRIYRCHRYRDIWLKTERCKSSSNSHCSSHGSGAALAVPKPSASYPPHQPASQQTPHSSWMLPLPLQAVWQ